MKLFLKIKRKQKNKNIFLESRIPSTAVVVSLVLVDMFFSVYVFVFVLAI
jgi:hypothetical protein